MKKVLIFLCIGLLAGVAVFAQTAKKHPNLADARNLIDQAYAKISAAQKANEFDLGGHAAKAKNSLNQANQELKLAVTEANDNTTNKTAEEKPKATTELKTNVGSKHPNLELAQQFISQAYAKINDAQQANEFDLGGHAAKAKKHLEDANQELKLAAKTANQ